MVRDVLDDAEKRMKQAVEAFQRSLRSLRTGRASPVLLENVRVDYYGTSMPINQLANISAPEARVLVIQPWDQSALPEIEKAIIKSDLGLTPSNDGQVIRITLPQLTEERRKELVKQAKRIAEEGRVAVRNVRRDVNEQLKDVDLSEDERRRAMDDVQKLTDRFIKNIDDILAAKEEEILEV